MTQRLNIPAAMAFLVTLTTPVVAFAQEDEVQTFVQAIFLPIVTIAFSIAGPILGLLILKGIRSAEKKWNFDLDDKLEAKLLQYVDMGVAYAEEQARKALHERKPPKTGDEKRIMAVEFVAEQLERTGVAEMGADAITKLVESKLNVARPVADADAEKRLNLPRNSNS